MQCFISLILMENGMMEVLERDKVFICEWGSLE